VPGRFDSILIVIFLFVQTRITLLSLRAAKRRFAGVALLAARLGRSLAAATGVGPLTGACRIGGPELKFH